MKIKILIAAIILLTLVVGYQFPKDISEDITGYEFSHHDDTPDTKRNITINGQYSKRIFGPDKFNGQIIIDKQEFQVNIETGSNKESGTPLVYLEEGVSLVSDGTLFIDKGLSNITVLLYEREDGKGSFSANEGTILSAPAISLSEAETIAEEMLAGTAFKDIL